MSDYISRQAAIDALKTDASFVIYDDHGNYTADGLRILEVLTALPSTQPEIIRCKECRYYEWMSNRVPAEQTWFCHNWNAETGKDDYCSYAER